MTWNPVTGCTKVSACCKHCYAERMAKRLRATGVTAVAVTSAVTTSDDPAAAAATLRAASSDGRA